MIDNKEVAGTSCYFYKDGDKIFAGPVWDMDSALGTDTVNDHTDDTFLATRSVKNSPHAGIFHKLASYPEFVQLVTNLYASDYQNRFPELASRIDALQTEISDSAEMNHTRWSELLGTVNNKKVLLPESFEQAVSELKTWVLGRLDSFKLFFRVTSATVQNDQVLITYKDTAGTDVKAAVWSEVNDQDDLKWYPLTAKDGVWSVTINPKDHHSEGTFQVHVYGQKDGKEQLLGNTFFFYENTQTAVSPFVDVQDPSAFYYDAVLWSIGKGISGTGEGRFSPDSTCTRAQAVMFLWLAAGKPASGYSVSYKDVPSSCWYGTALAWATERGIVMGTSEGNFEPRKTITHAQFLTFLYRAAGSPEATKKNETILHYYDKPLQWASARLLLGTRTSTELASNPCSRGWVVTYLYKSR